MGNTRAAALEELSAGGPNDLGKVCCGSCCILPLAPPPPPPPIPLLKQESMQHWLKRAVEDTVVAYAAVEVPGKSLTVAPPPLLPPLAAALMFRLGPKNGPLAPVPSQLRFCSRLIFCFLLGL